MRIKQIVAIILILCFAFSPIGYCTYVHASEINEPEYEVAELTVYSNLSMKEKVTGIYQNNILFFDIEDLCAMSGVEITNRTEGIVELISNNHVRSFTLNYNADFLVEKLYGDEYKTEMPTLYIDNTVYVSMLRFLRYMGANVIVEPESEIQIMVNMNYNILDALWDLKQSDLGNFFWWDEVDTGKENLKWKLKLAGFHALLNRDSNVFRMAIDAEGIEQEALEDALISIVQNEGAGYIEKQDERLSLINLNSDALGVATDEFGMVLDAVEKLYGKDKFLSSIDDAISNLELVESSLINALNAMDSMRQFEAITGAQKNLLQKTILAYPEKSDTLCNGWEKVFKAAQNVDTNLQSEYRKQYNVVEQMLRSNAYDLLDSTANEAGTNPVSAVWDATMLIFEAVPYTSNMIEKKTKLYNAYNCSVIQLIAKEMVVSIYSELYYNNFYYNRDYQAELLEELKYAMILQLKSTLTTRDYLIASGYLTESYEAEMRTLNGETACLLNLTENCELINMTSDITVDEDMSWVKEFVGKPDLIDMNRFLSNFYNMQYSSDNVDWESLIRFALLHIDQSEISYVDNGIYMISKEKIANVIKEFFGLELPDKSFGNVGYDNGAFYFEWGEYGELGMPIIVADDIERIANNRYSIRFEKGYIWPEDFETGKLNPVQDWDMYYSDKIMGEFRLSL